MHVKYSKCYSITQSRDHSTGIKCDVIYQNESNVGNSSSSESSAEVIIGLKIIFITNFDFGEITLIMMLFCQGNKNIILNL